VQKNNLKFILLLEVFLASGAWAGAGQGGKLESSGPEKTDQLIIKYKAGAAAENIVSQASAQSVMQATIQAANRSGIQIALVRKMAGGGHVFKMNKAQDLDSLRILANNIKNSDPSIEYIEPDARMHALSTVNDPYFTKQWHYYEPAGGINLPSAWDVTRGAGSVIAVIDSGIRPHPDLAANLLPGYDFITDLDTAADGNGRDFDASDPGDFSTVACNPGGLPNNSSWHGTHVAGTIAALSNNSLGVAGIAYQAKIVPVRVLGKCGGYPSDIAEGMIWASGGTVAGVPDNANPAKVMNLSLGGVGVCSQTFQNAVNLVRAKGTSIVVAAGNSNLDVSNFSPANCNGVIAVAAVNRAGGRAYYSNFGTGVDIAAPGGEISSSSSINGIYSTLNVGATTPGADNYDFYEGTSMAAPHVTGVVALMQAIQPGLSPDQIKAKLKSTARPFPTACAQCGTGIVNAAAAVNSAQTNAQNKSWLIPVINLLLDD
jgi:serine protease